MWRRVWPHYFGASFTAKSGDTLRRTAVAMPFCLWLGATRGQGWLHIGAVCNGMAWVDVEVEC